jgi:hypothetical protein
MKLDKLRQIIREEVRAAVKEELQEMLNEAVKVASTPEPKAKTSGYKAVTQKDISRTWSTGKLNKGTVPLEEMLNQTAQSMTGEDSRNFANSGGVKKPNFASSMGSQMGMTENSGPLPGIDISKLDFVSKAKEVLDLANKKTKQRVG